MIVCFVYFLFRLRAGFSLWYVFFAGLSFGFALLTKGTAYIYCFPFLAAFTASIAMKPRVKVLFIILFIMLFGILINLPYYLRFHEVIREYQTEFKRTTNVAMDPALFVSNVVRNMALQSSLPSKRLNNFFKKAVINFHRMINVSPDDGRITYMQNKFDIPDFSQGGDMQNANPAHFFLISFFVIVFIFQRGDFSPLTRLYFYVLMGTFVLFNLILKWQPWDSHFFLALFVLFCPLLAWWTGRYKVGLVFVMAALLIFAAMPVILANKSRPMIGGRNIFNTPRDDQYIFLWGTWHYRQAGLYIRDLTCSEMGVYFTPNKNNHYPFEYLLWVYTHRKNPIRIEHINIDNTTAVLQYPLGKFDPCVVFGESEIPSETTMAVGHKLFIRARQFGEYAVFLPQAR